MSSSTAMPGIRPANLPGNVRPYRTIGPFGRESLPAGLKRTHDLAEGVWGLVELVAGRIAFVWEDGSGDREELVAPAAIVVPPQVPHHVEATGEFSLTITFHRA
ncbi:MAG TPA: DUF1971 domain-containing protein [Sphingomonadaceae bacterium]|nr:DUF1971 domain-containing protein [Sphingomonadaceae bacterium]